MQKAPVSFLRNEVEVGLEEFDQYSLKLFDEFQVNVNLVLLRKTFGIF